MDRQYRDLGARERAGVTNSLASLFFGSDYTTQVDVRSAGLGWRPERDRRWSVRAAWEDERTLRLEAEPLSGRFAPVLSAWSLQGARVDIERTGRSGEVGEHQRAYTVRLIGSQATGTNLLGEAVRPLAVRLEGDVRAEWPVAGGSTIVASLLGGVTAGRDLPPQWLQFAGGPWSGPGYGFHEFAGRYIASPRLEWRVPVPFLPVPLGKYGKSPARAQLVPFVQAVVLGACGHRAGRLAPGGWRVSRGRPGHAALLRPAARGRVARTRAGPVAIRRGHRSRVLGHSVTVRGKRAGASAARAAGARGSRTTPSSTTPATSRSGTAIRRIACARPRSSRGRWISCCTSPSGCWSAR